MAKRVAAAAALLGMVGLAGGCAPLLVGGAAGTVAYTGAQERSTGRALDDTTIQLAINHLLFQDSVDLYQHVNLQVVEGRVLMTGTVPSQEERITAARLAWQADGVQEVLNELQVKEGSFGNAVRDTWITTQLRGRILADKEIKDINYTIDTVDGTVYLIGIARSEEELRRVTNHARHIRGVKQVVSHVQLRDDPERST